MSPSAVYRAYISAWNETMYTEFYGFTEEPFNLTPDLSFLFLSPRNRDALAAIMDGVERKKGFIVVTGDVGTGKTMIIRAFLEKADSGRFKIVSILNPNLSFKEMMDAILLEFGLEGEPGGVYDQVTRLHSALIDEDKRGRTVVLIIDEAQGIPLETLQNLRMLSNLETSTHKLIQVIMIGQPEFENMLKRDELHQFRQRVALRFEIHSFTRAESIKYIKHRLSRVASKENRVFTRWALRSIVARAGGVPRTINILCDNALMTGFGRQKKPVTSEIVKRVIADLEVKPRPRPFQLAAAIVAGLLLTIALAWWSPLKEIIPLRGPSQAGARGMIIGSIKEKAPREPKLEMAAPSTLPTLEEVATAPDQELNIFEKPRGIEGLRDYVFPQIITVKEGDNLFRLTMKVYGYVNERLMEWVLINNPQIKSPTQIAVGQRIVFAEKPLDHESPGRENPGARPERPPEQTPPGSE
jgi:general secretion pathway protein A